MRGLITAAVTRLKSSLAASDGANLSGFSHAESYTAGTLGAKAKQVISIADAPYNAVAGVDCAAAIIAAADATTGVIVVPPGAFIATATTSNSDDILGVLDRIRCDGTLAITLASGTHSLTEQIVVNSPDAHRITVIGATPVETAATSQVSVSGAAKNYSVIIGVASSAGVAVGDYALIRTDVTGTGDYYAHAGVWKVTAVDSGGANRLTLLNTHHGAAFPTNTLTGGAVVILKTILQFTGCDGFRFEGGQQLGLLDHVALVGDYNLAAATGTNGAHGIILSAPLIIGAASSNAVFNFAGNAALGDSVGVSGWGEQGIAVSGRCGLVANYVASCSNRKRGWYAEGGHIRAKLSIGSGNGEDGYISDLTGGIQAALSFACGNGLNGFWSTNFSLIAAATSVATGNLANGYEARGLTRLAADLSTSMNNASKGFSATDGGMMDADSAVATGNGDEGFYASSGGVIDCDNSTSASNTGYGYLSECGSVVRAAGATVSGNTVGDYRSTNGSTLFESGGTVRADDVPNYSTNYRVYSDNRTFYGGIVTTSAGNVALTATGTTRITMISSGGVRVHGGTPTTSAGELGLGTTVSATIGAAGAASALPATPESYLTVGVGGTVYKIPLYNV